MASLSLVQGRAEVGGSRIEAAPMALQKDKPPRPDLSERLSPEDVRLLAINALGLEIRVKAPPRRRTTIDALGMEPMRRNVQRPSRGAAPVRQRPSTEETVAEFEDMRLRPLRGQGIVEGQPLASMFLIEPPRARWWQSHPSALRRPRELSEVCLWRACFCRPEPQPLRVLLIGCATRGSQAPDLGKHLCCHWRCALLAVHGFGAAHPRG